MQGHLLSHLITDSLQHFNALLLSFTLNFISLFLLFPFSPLPSSYFPDSPVLSFDPTLFFILSFVLMSLPFLSLFLNHTFPPPPHLHSFLLPILQLPALCLILFLPPLLSSLPPFLPPLICPFICFLHPSLSLFSTRFLLYSVSSDALASSPLHS